MKTLDVLWIVAFLFCVAPLGQSQLHQGLAGIVADKQSVPIRNSRLIVYSESGRITTVFPTDDGRFALDLAPGTYDVMVTAISFAPVCKRVEIQSGHLAKFAPKMSPDVDHLQD